MSTDKPRSTVATRMSGIREDWLAKAREEILEPDLPIVDPHHHLWDFPAHRYLLPDLLADTGSGHKIESTVFIECTACYRADGPPELRTLGETEFVNGIAAMSASGGYGPTRAAAGIVGLVDLTWARAPRRCCAPTWRRRGRASKASVTRPPGRTRRPRSTTATPTLPRISIATTQSSAKGSRRSGGSASVSTPGSITPRSRISPRSHALSRTADRARSCRRSAGARLVCGQARRDLRRLEGGYPELASCPNVYMKLGGLGMRINGFQFHHRDRPPSSEELAAPGGPTSRPASRPTARPAACSRATSPSTRSPAPTPSTGTPSSAWRQVPRHGTRPCCSATPRGASTGSTEFDSAGAHGTGPDHVFPFAARGSKKSCEGTRHTQKDTQPWFNA